jgi:CheY-like chemotaxis protein
MKIGLATVRVLVADDSENMRSLLVGMLMAVGITEIRQASNGKDALDVLRHWTADIAFVDLHMTPIDGIEFTRTIRAARGVTDPYLPIIMLTGHAQLTRVTEARDAGVNEFLVKPLAAKAVVERLKAVIDRQRKFVRSNSYVGPDRRRKVLPDYQGPWRRESDSVEKRLGAEGAQKPDARRP